MMLSQTERSEIRPLNILSYSNDEFLLPEHCCPKTDPPQASFVDIEDHSTFRGGQRVCPGLQAYERLHWNQLSRLLSVLDTLPKGRRCFPEYRTLQEGAEFWAGAGASCVRGRCDRLGKVRLPPVFEEGATCILHLKLESEANVE
jgi:hypothetical protein